MRHSLVLAGICLAIGSIAAADPGWIDFGNGPGDVRVEVHQSGPHGVELELELAGVSLSAATTDSGSFTVAEIPGLGRIGQPGEPALPALRRFVEIPEGARAEVELEVLERRAVDLAAEGFAAPIMPVQLPRPKCDCEEARAWRFSYKPEAYRGTVRHEAAAFTGPFTFRDHRMMLLTVSPVSYSLNAFMRYYLFRIK